MVTITSFQVPESPVRLQQAGVRAVLDKKDLGIGTLYISESALCWQKVEDKGFSIDYPKITLHAISKDVNVYPSECIYVLLDGHISLPNIEENRENPQENEDKDEREEFSDAESEPDVSELILVPENLALVPMIYESIKICQELNPDPADMDEEDEEDNMFADAEDMMEGEDESIDYHNASGDPRIEEIAAQLQNQRMHYTNNGHTDDDQFEDAD